MNTKNNIKQIDFLDIDIFKQIHTQTSPGERRSLLAIQRTTARKHDKFSYLEIGSYLGGTIQPYFLDDRCYYIYSIDPRPVKVVDDRSQGYIDYDNNSSQRMLDLLKNMSTNNINKIECIELNSSDIDPTQIVHRPEIVFIDGEHTDEAALADFFFCEKVISDTGTIIFHDFSIIYQAVIDACKYLNEKGRNYTAFKLEEEIFAIFFDKTKVESDKYLNKLHKKNAYFLRLNLISFYIKRKLPKPIKKIIRPIYRFILKIVS